jgi:hypothetical protein
LAAGRFSRVSRPAAWHFTDGPSRDSTYRALYFSSISRWRQPMPVQRRPRHHLLQAAILQSRADSISKFHIFTTRWFLADEVPDLLMHLCQCIRFTASRYAISAYLRTVTCARSFTPQSPRFICAIDLALLRALSTISTHLLGLYASAYATPISPPASILAIYFAALMLAALYYFAPPNYFITLEAIETEPMSR